MSDRHWQRGIYLPNYSVPPKYELERYRVQLNTRSRDTFDIVIYSDGSKFRQYSSLKHLLLTELQT